MIIWPVFSRKNPTQASLPSSHSMLRGHAHRERERERERGNRCWHSVLHYVFFFCSATRSTFFFFSTTRQESKLAGRGVKIGFECLANTKSAVRLTTIIVQWSLKWSISGSTICQIIKFPAEYVQHFFPCSSAFFTFVASRNGMLLVMLV